MVYKKIVFTLSLLLSRFIYPKEFSLIDKHCFEKEGKLFCTILDTEKLGGFLERLTRHERACFLKNREAIDKIKRESRLVFTEIIQKNKTLEKAYLHWYGTEPLSFGIGFHLSDQEIGPSTNLPQLCLQDLLKDTRLNQFYELLSVEEQVVFAHVTARLAVACSNSLEKLKAIFDRSADIERRYLRFYQAKKIVFTLEFLDVKIDIAYWS
jgi:hypothetical protein